MSFDFVCCILSLNGCLGIINDSALEGIFYNEMRYINLRFTYLLTRWINKSLACCREHVIPYSVSRVQDSTASSQIRP